MSKCELHRKYIDSDTREMRIFNLVDESERVWHAGVSSWAGKNNLNDTAIGIEIVNRATCHDGHLAFPPYHPAQTEAVKQFP